MFVFAIHTQKRILLKELKFRGYPVPNGLIDARKKGDRNKAENCLKEFRQNMKAFIANEGKIPEGVKDKSKSSHNLKNWNQVLFCALPRGLETRVKGKITDDKRREAISLFDKGTKASNVG